MRWEQKVGKRHWWCASGDQKMHRGPPIRQHASPQQIPTGLGGLGDRWAPAANACLHPRGGAGSPASHARSRPASSGPWTTHQLCPSAPSSSAPPPVPPAACECAVVTSPSLPTPSQPPCHRPPTSATAQLLPSPLNSLPTMAPPACGPRPTQ